MKQIYGEPLSKGLVEGIVFQIRGDLNNDEEKVKAKARRIRDLYGKIPINGYIKRKPIFLLNCLQKNG